MSLTQDKKAAKTALATLKAVERELPHELKQGYMRALEVVARYNGELRRAKPVETIKLIEAPTEPLRSEIADLKNQLDQAKRQLEKERNRFPDYGDVDAIKRWALESDLDEKSRLASLMAHICVGHIIAGVNDGDFDFEAFACGESGEIFARKTGQAVMDAALDFRPDLADKIRETFRVTDPREYRFSS